MRDLYVGMKLAWDIPLLPGEAVLARGNEDGLRVLWKSADRLTHTVVLAKNLGVKRYWGNKHCQKKGQAH